MKRWWAGALAPILMAAAAPAIAEPDANAALIEASDDGLILYYAGTIDFDDFIALARLAEKTPDAKRLVIASQGGEIRSAQLIGALVAQRKLIVQVDHVCASACTLILLSSADRWAGPDARIGFHQSYRVAPPDVAGVNIVRDEGEDAPPASSIKNAGRPAKPDMSPFGDSSARRVMEAAGVEAGFIDRALSTPSADMWYPDRGELLRAGVVTVVADAPNPGAPSWSVDRDAVAASLTEPLWTTLKSSRPALWAGKVDDIWRMRNAGVSVAAATMSARSDLSGDLMKDMARAPDELLGRILALYGAQAVQARKDGYRICRLSVQADEMAGDDAAGADDPYRLADEDLLLVELLRLDRFAKPVNERKAQHMVEQFAIDHLDFAADADQPSDMDADCRDGLHVIEQVSIAPEKQRIALYRALMSLAD